jgi:hypothetical protein
MQPTRRMTSGGARLIWGRYADRNEDTIKIRMMSTWRRMMVRKRCARSRENGGSQAGARSRTM